MARAKSQKGERGRAGVDDAECVRVKRDTHGRQSIWKFGSHLLKELPQLFGRSSIAPDISMLYSPKAIGEEPFSVVTLAPLIPPHHLSDKTRKVTSSSLSSAALHLDFYNR